jgi:hypothetical protein
MTPEQEKAWAEAYRRLKGIEPPMPRDEVERRVCETLATGKDGDFAVVKNLHVVIKKGRPSWVFKFTPKRPPTPLGKISISKPDEWPNERPIKKKLGNYSEVRTCKSAWTITYDIAVQQAERLHDLIKNARQNMPEIDERKMFALWSRGSQSDLASLNFSELKFLEMLVNVTGWLPAPAIGSGEDDIDINDDYEVQASEDETQVAKPQEVEDDYQIVDERELNRSYLRDE